MATEKNITPLIQLSNAFLRYSGIFNLAIVLHLGRFIKLLSPSVIDSTALSIELVPHRNASPKRIGAKMCVAQKTQMKYMWVRVKVSYWLLART